MANYALVNKNTNIVDMVVAWDGNEEGWRPDEIYLPILLQNVSGDPAMGWSYDGALFAPPPEIEPIALPQSTVSGAETI
jgi:hypothetical protein